MRLLIYIIRLIVFRLIRRDKSDQYIKRFVEFLFPETNFDIQTYQNWRASIKQQDDVFRIIKNRGRNRLDNIDEKIREELRKDPYITARILAVKLGHAHKTILFHLKHIMHYRRIAIRWVPHTLTEHQKLLRVLYAKQMKEMLSICAEVDFANIVTGDESYFYFHYPASHKYETTETTSSASSQPVAHKPGLGDPKQMFSVFFNVEGPVTVHALESHTTMDGEKYIRQTLKPLLAYWIAKTKHMPLEQKLAIEHANKRIFEVASRYQTEFVANLNSHTRIGNGDKLMLDTNNIILQNTERLITPAQISGSPNLSNVNYPPPSSDILNFNIRPYHHRGTKTKYILEERSLQLPTSFNRRPSTSSSSSSSNSTTTSATSTATTSSSPPSSSPSTFEVSLPPLPDDPSQATFDILETPITNEEAEFAAADEEEDSDSEVSEQDNPTFQFAADPDTFVTTITPREVDKDDEETEEDHEEQEDDTTDYVDSGHSKHRPNRSSKRQPKRKPRAKQTTKRSTKQPGKRKPKTTSKQKGELLLSPASSSSTTTDEEFTFVKGSDGRWRLLGDREDEWIPELIVHVDNAASHRSEETYTWMKNTPLVRMPQPPYSPDISPCDFFLFGAVKQHLKSKRMKSVQDIHDNILTYMTSRSKDDYRSVATNWLYRLDWVIRHNGDYYSPEEKERQQRRTRPALLSSDGPLPSSPNESTPPRPTPPQTSTLPCDGPSSSSPNEDTHSAHSSVTSSSELSSSRYPSSSYLPYNPKSPLIRSPPGMVLYTNDGNTCYINSVMQCFTSILPLAQFILSISRTIPDSSPSAAYSLLINHIWKDHPTIPTFTLSSFIRRYFPGVHEEFTLGLPQDCSEFFLYIFQVLVCFEYFASEL